MYDLDLSDVNSKFLGKTTQQEFCRLVKKKSGYRPSRTAMSNLSEFCSVFGFGLKVRNNSKFWRLTYQKLYTVGQFFLGAQ